jgi:hypothetical protein
MEAIVNAARTGGNRRRKDICLRGA